MNFITLEQHESIAVARMQRGKVHAVNAAAVDDMLTCFEQLAKDESVKGVVFTGSDKFFSFGFDVPELLTYSREQLKNFLMNFARLKRNLFLFSKPLIGALNGHTVAGGCMLALATDYRVMASEKAKISLNEINIGASVFAGAVEMVRFCCGDRNAELILTGGAMYSPDEALALGMVDKLSPSETLLEDAIAVASGLADKNGPAFRSIKLLLRQPIMDSVAAREEAAVDEFIDIWLTEESQEQLRQVVIKQ